MMIARAAVLVFVLAMAGGWGIALEARDDVLVRAQQGDVEAQFVIGYRYYVGAGAPYDPGRAAQWYARAAEAGHAAAMNNLAILKMNGDGVWRDPIAGRELLVRASQAGLHEATANLGESYRSGFGGSIDQDLGSRLIRAASLHVPPPGFEERLRTGWVITSPRSRETVLARTKSALASILMPIPTLDHADRPTACTPCRARTT
ncbi:MAG: tetratricopeptide repeat protein [Alkalilacustris sp.]